VIYCISHQPSLRAAVFALTAFPCEQPPPHHVPARSSWQLRSRFEYLNLHAGRLIQSVLLYARDFTGITIDTPRILAIGVLRPQLRRDPNGVPAGISNESPWDDLHSVCDGAERPFSRSTRDPLSLRVQAHCDRHLSHSSRGEFGIEDNIASDGHGVGKVSVDLVEDVFRRSAEEDGAIG